MEQEKVVTETGTHYLDDLGIVRTTAFLGVEETLDQAKASIAAIRKVSAGKKRPLLLDMRPIKSQTREVRTYYASPEASGAYSAAAILVASPMSRMIGNMFIGIGKLPVPTRLFSTEDEAIEWLKGFLD
jgi:hypothetical protein